MFSSPHHPQTDGKCEKMNHTIIHSLKLTCKDQTDWAQNITPVLMAYRATVTLPTGISPHYAMFGREMNLGIDSELIKSVETAPVIQPHTSELVKKLQVTHDMIQQNLRDSQIPIKNIMILELKNRNSKLVRKYYYMTQPQNRGNPPNLRWTGPFMITYKSPDGLSYKLRNCNTGRERRALVHSNRLRSYNDDRDTFYNRHIIARPVSQNNT